MCVSAWQLAVVNCVYLVLTGRSKGREVRICMYVCMYFAFLTHHLYQCKLTVEGATEAKDTTYKYVRLKIKVFSSFLK